MHFGCFFSLQASTSSATALMAWQIRGKGLLLQSGQRLSLPQKAVVAICFSRYKALIIGIFRGISSLRRVYQAERSRDQGCTS